MPEPNIQLYLSFLQKQSQTTPDTRLASLTLEELYQQTLEGISDAFVSFDFDWNILHANSKAAAWGNFTVQEIKGRNLWEAFPILTQTPLHDLYHRCMETRQPQRLEYQSPSVKRWYNVRVHPTPQGISVYISDITDNKRVADGEDQFRIMANSIPQLGWMANAEGWIYWYNDRWYEYTGTTLEEMEGWGWQKVHHPDYVERVVEIVTRHWQQDQPWELTFPLRRRDGDYRWFLTKIFPIKDPAGNVMHWIGTNTDIHDQKLANDTLEQKIVERTNELEAANEHLRSVNEELQQFNYVASHDLQEPLRKIKIFSERIKIQDLSNLSSTSQGVAGSDNAFCGPNVQSSKRPFGFQQY